MYNALIWVSSTLVNDCEVGLRGGVSLIGTLSSGGYELQVRGDANWNPS